MAQTADRLTETAKRVKAAAPPWGLIFIAALLIGLGVACVVQAIVL